MTTLQVLGLILQLGGTALTATALVSELRDRRPKIEPPSWLPTRNPWADDWRTPLPKPSHSDRQKYLERLQGTDFMSSYGMPSRVGSDPELLDTISYVRQVFREAREDLRRDWERQERGSQQLHHATVALFDSLQAAHVATRRRVLVEMVGLLIVAVGTLVSSL